jgi:putative transposase
LDEAIRTGQFIQNSCLRHWEENIGVTRNDLQKLCSKLAKNKETPWTGKLNSQARQAHADRAWADMVKNHHLAKSIFDASWYQFTQWLQYFACIYGTIVIAVPPHNTTTDCSSCGAKVHKTLSTRTHQCSVCKTVLDRDHNAARNILAKGLKLLAGYINGTVGHTGTDPFMGERSGTV